jgi:hypothetical protein
MMGKSPSESGEPASSESTRAAGYTLFDYFRKDQHPNQAVLVATVPNGTVFDGFPVSFPTAGIFPNRDPWHVTPSTGTPLWDKVTTWSAEDVLIHEISDIASIKNILGYRNDKTDTSEDNGDFNLPLGSAVDGVTQYTQHQWTDELNLDVSRDDKRLRNKAGCSYPTRRLTPSMTIES